MAILICLVFIGGCKQSSDPGNMPGIQTDWEVVSRAQRVQGTIAAMTMEGGAIKSMDLKVTKNVQAPNNPADYDYVGQTLHLVMDEKLSDAGYFQDKWKQGASYLVNFAQYIIPPNDKAVLATRFEFIYYENNGQFYDKKGNLFDLGSENAGSEEVSTPLDEFGLLSIRMIDESAGWAVAKQGVWRTEDGGMRWDKVLDAGFPDVNPRFNPTFFLDAEHAWVAVQQESLSVLHTSDGGKTWAKSSIEDANGIKSLYFTDVRNGWMMTFIDAAAGGQELVDIFKTNDGGKHWIKVASTLSARGNFPLSGVKSGIAFTSPTTGWAAGGLTNVEGVVWLYRSTDAGLTWNPIDLPPMSHFSKSLISTAPPIWFNSKEGILPVWTNQLNRENHRFHETFYITKDGGETWTPSTPVELEERGVYDFTNIKRGWVATGGKFHASDDGGQTWNEIQSNEVFQKVLRDGRLKQLNFVSDKVGWALASPSEIYKTSDGGLSWVLSPKAGEMKNELHSPKDFPIKRIETNLYNVGKSNKLELSAKVDHYGNPITWHLNVDGTEKITLTLAEPGIYGAPADFTIEDIDGDKKREVFIYRYSLGSGGAVGLNIYSPSKEWKTILSIENPFEFDENHARNRYEVKYLGDWKASFVDHQSGLKATIPLDKEEYQDREIKFTTWVDPISEYEFKDENRDGIKEIIAIQRIIGSSHPDTIGLLKTSYHFKNGKYHAETISVDDEQGNLVQKVDVN